MFPSSRLDSPPQTLPYHRPRPWSPDPHGPLPTLSSLANRHHADDDLYHTSVPLNRQGQEASEASIEALDLADYARTLRSRQPEEIRTELQQTQFSPQNTQDNFPSYPPASVIPELRASLDSLSPPSLVSRGATHSSSGTHLTSRGGRRPFSLPTPNSSNYALNSSSRSHHPQPRIADPQATYPGINPSEADISQFPAWSRSWYQSQNRPNGGTSPPPIDEFYNAIPPSHFNSGAGKKQPKNVFDPDYVHYDQDYYPGTEPSGLSDPVFVPQSSLGHESTRGLLPWGQEDNSAVVNPSTKEERIRMLEREFGPKGRNRSRGDLLDEEGKPLIGTVDEKGNLVTQGPKKRIALRVFQILFALGAGIPAIYAAVVIKPNPPAPPAGTAPAFVLYIVSILTFLLLLYLFLFRPCCFHPRRKDRSPMDNPLTGGMMVLPVPNTGGKKNKGKKPKKGGGKGMGGGDGDVQVNLIVDPNVFSGGRDDEDSDDEASDGDNGLPGGYYGVGGGAKGRAKARRNKRRSVFAGLAMEAEWKIARAWAKKIAFVDAVGVVVWGAVFVIVLIGKRCPSGGFDGWCNPYNVSSACACLLCVAFGVGIFFDVKDLHASKASPRTRT